MKIVKRITLTLLIVSIACAGCYDKTISKFSDIPIRPPKQKDSKRSSALRAENVRLLKEISRLKVAESKTKTLLLTIPLLETALDSKIKTLRVVTDKFQSEQHKSKRLQKQTESFLVRISELKVMLEKQKADERARFERLENVFRMYEVAVDAQSVTIETLQKLCRLYERPEGEGPE